jgi:hypothetical protein
MEIWMINLRGFLAHVVDTERARALAYPWVKCTKVIARARRSLSVSDTIVYKYGYLMLGCMTVCGAMHV